MDGFSLRCRQPLSRFFTHAGMRTASELYVVGPVNILLIMLLALGLLLDEQSCAQIIFL